RRPVDETPDSRPSVPHPSIQRRPAFPSAGTPRKQSVRFVSLQPSPKPSHEDMQHLPRLRRRAVEAKAAATLRRCATIQELRARGPTWRLNLYGGSAAQRARRTHLIGGTAARQGAAQRAQPLANGAGFDAAKAERDARLDFAAAGEVTQGLSARGVLARLRV